MEKGGKDSGNAWKMINGQGAGLEQRLYYSVFVKPLHDALIDSVHVPTHVRVVLVEKHHIGAVLRDGAAGVHAERAAKRVPKPVRHLPSGQHAGRIEEQDDEKELLALVDALRIGGAVPIGQYLLEPRIEGRDERIIAQERARKFVFAFGQTGFLFTD